MGKRKKEEFIVDKYFIDQAIDIAEHYHEYKTQLSEMRYHLENYKECTAEDFIEFKSLSGVSYGDKVQTSNKSDLVGKLAINYNNGLERINGETYKALFQEYKLLHDKVSAFEIGLMLLIGRPSRVARQIFIERKIWKSILDEKGTPMCNEQIRKAKNEAINKIAAYLQSSANRKEEIAIGVNTNLNSGSIYDNLS